MGKILVIAEKPSAGMDMAKVLQCTKRQDGYIEGEKYIVTWAVGHLVGLKYPEEHEPELKAWKLETLPMLFDIKDSLKILPNTSKQFNIIKSLIHRNDVDSIINAGDAGREGYLIQEWIYRMAGNRKPKKVLWASSLTDEALKKAFDNLKDPKEFIGLLDEAEARAEGDYLLGINYSRALTLTKSNGVPLRYGRCQTPVLNLIATRDKEIEEFVPQPYSNIIADFKFREDIFSANLIEESGKVKAFFKEQADQVLEEIKGYQAVVKEYKTEEKRQKAPLLFDLTTLQKTMNSKYGYSAKETLEIAQGLYETHKILSYPRTDSRYLSDDIYNEVEEHLKSCSFGEYEKYIKKLDVSVLEKDKRYFNNLKVSDHHALIPTINSKTAEIYQTLSEREKNVFDAVVRSFVAIFLPEYRFDKTTILLSVKNYLFKTSGIAIKNVGYKEIYINIEETESKEEEQEQKLPILSVEDIGTVEKFQRKDGMTKAPAHYTANTILAAMEKLNIGTPATRAELLEKLQNPKSQYIKLEKKNYIATDLGRKLIGLVPEELKAPELTARFEEKLKEIEEGKLGKDEFLKNEVSEIKKHIEKFKEEPTKKIEYDRKSIGSCPYCKQGEIVEYPKSYGCNRYKEGCNFTIWKTIAGKKITETMAAQIVSKGKTSLLKGFKSKVGNEFSARLVLKEGKIAFEFEPKK